LIYARARGIVRTRKRVRLRRSRSQLHAIMRQDAAANPC